MFQYIIKRILYGFLVLWGVITLVFFIFYLKPGSPADMMGGQHTSPELAKIINKELGLDLPLHQQYLFYFNDISPISVLSSNQKSKIFADETKYHFKKLASVGNDKFIAFKKPFLRRSYQTKRSVSTIINEALPSTTLLAVISILLALFIGIGLGTFAALKKGSFLDGGLLFASTLGMSGPSFFMAIIIAWVGGYLFSDVINIPIIPIVCFFIFFMLIFARKRREQANSIGQKIGSTIGKSLLYSSGVWIVLLIIHSLPQTNQFFLGSISLRGTGLNMTGSLHDIHPFEGEYLALKNLILPVITLAIRPITVITQLTRNSLLDVLKNEYIRTAKAKGLSKRIIIAKHALKNALNPLITAASGWFASLLAGAVFVEFVFGWQGLGWEVFDALQKDDFPVVMGVVLVVACLFVIINISVDLLYGFLDPRVRKT